MVFNNFFSHFLYLIGRIWIEQTELLILSQQYFEICSSAKILLKDIWYFPKKVQPEYSMFVLL